MPGIQLPVEDTWVIASAPSGCLLTRRTSAGDGGRTTHLREKVCIAVRATLTSILTSIVLLCWRNNESSRH